MVANAADPAPRDAGDAPPGRNGRRALALLSITALGVVYGDIGTSPLYALRECFSGPHAVAPTRENVLGVLSLIFWSLIIVVTVKYLAFILRADNRGEGGILALMALVHPEHGTSPRRARGARLALILLALFGAGLLYGDGMITPAISVLSAVEGLAVATHAFEPFVIPITIGILVGLFLAQRRGTGRIGVVFGPITLTWFATLAALGVWNMAGSFEVLRALNPMFGASFFAENGLRGFLVLGSVFLVVTGAEALYADMGHFGARPIRISWFSIVLPALLLNYMGQGALLLRDPSAAVNPFYLMAPSWALYPLVALATAATIIASQAIISGAFSLTMQAVHLGYVPRLEIRHTSQTERGQIYIPQVNWLLMLASVGLVLSFRSSSNLAAAYGVAVTADMVITALLFFVVAREVFKWSLPVAAGLVAVFLAIDVSFFLAMAVKIPDGGWFPLVVAAGIYTLMTTWRRGRHILSARLAKGRVAIESFVDGALRRGITRVAGTAVFMTGDPTATPSALVHNLKHNKVLHKQVVLLSIRAEEVPRIPESERVTMEELGSGFHRVVARFGFMEDPDVPEVMRIAGQRGLDFDPYDTTFFLGRERLIASREPNGMAIWREKLFAVMARNSQQATTFFRIPTDRVVEVGSQIRL